MAGRTIISGSRWRPYAGAVPPPNLVVPAHIPFRPAVIARANPRIGGSVFVGRLPRFGVPAAPGGRAARLGVVVALRAVPVVHQPRVGRIPRNNPAVPASRPRPCWIQPWAQPRFGGAVIVGWLPRFGITVGGSGATLLDHQLLTDALFADEGVTPVPVVAGTWYNLDLVWGVPSGSADAVITTSLSCG